MVAGGARGAEPRGVGEDAICGFFFVAAGPDELLSRDGDSTDLAARRTEARERKTRQLDVYLGRHELTI